MYAECLRNTLLTRTGDLVAREGSSFTGRGGLPRLKKFGDLGDSSMVNDLSKAHQPVSDVFAANLQSATPLSSAMVDFYHRDGFVAPIPMFNAHQVAILCAELEKLSDPHQPNNPLWYEFHRNESGDAESVLFHALGAWRISPAFHDALWNPHFLRPARQILGGDIRFWHDQVFCKPPHCGGPVAWHQDYSYWTRTGPMNHLTCWIALDDADKENGCLHYVPGSHRWSLLPMPSIAGSLEAIAADLTQEQQEQLNQPVAIEIAAGQACFHHPLTLHGSEGNLSNRPRRAMVINVMLDGTQSLSDEPLLNGVDPIPKGQTVGGQFFPLLKMPTGI